MDLVFGFIAGLLTLINPCVLPVLPIALASSVSKHKLGPVALACGMSLTFTFFGIFVSLFGASIGINIDTIANIAAYVMIAFGLILLIPQLDQKFASATAGFSGNADSKMHAFETKSKDGLLQQFLGGALLGAVWVPCIGPTIGGAISLASQGESLIWATSIMLSFSAGISAVILALAYGTREAISARRDRMKVWAEKSKPIMGISFILVGLLIVTKLYQKLEFAILQALPIWLQDLSVAF